MRMQSTAQGNEGMKTASGVFLLGGDIHLRARARQRGVPITAGQYSEKGKGSTRRGTALQLCARLQLESNSHEPTVTLTAVLSEGYVSPKSPHALSAPTFSPGKGHSPEPLDRIYAGSARCDSPTSGREAPPSPRASRTRLDPLLDIQDQWKSEKVSCIWNEPVPQRPGPLSCHGCWKEAVTEQSRSRQGKKRKHFLNPLPLVLTGQHVTGQHSTYM
ncbi:uncharacterized protein LOC107049245 [Gallus gallus]|uniref:uncharacterized protein LOC107049245 n=1 Tax=Gallus gallus TaxID=9031 RepID=UPI001F01E0AC|nr:uncharacterized protein LOC107049245 [Gallus gallus]